MTDEKRILIVSNDENSTLVRWLGKKHYLPLVRRSMFAVIDLLKRHEMYAVILDRPLDNIDPLECILNIRDVDNNVPIFIPQQFIHAESRRFMHQFGQKVIPFQTMNELFKSIN